MYIVEQKGDSWPGIGLALGGGTGLIAGTLATTVFGTIAMPVGAGIGALAGVLIASVVAMRARRR